MNGTANRTRWGRRARRSRAIRGLATLMVLSILAITLQAVVFSGANFMDSESVSASFRAGSVSLVNPAEGTFVLRAEPIAAGRSEYQDLTVTGGPDLPATYVLTNVGITDEPAAAAFSTVLQLRIEDLTAGSVLFNNAAASFVSVNLGRINSGVSRRYRFTLTYPAASASRPLMGAAMTMDLEFIGVSL